jgi:sirohydrochlorin cobaltochelatase
MPIAPKPNSALLIVGHGSTENPDSSTPYFDHADEIRRVLMGHRRSELWGDKGLIAATMRCVDAIGMIEDLVTTDHETKEAFIQRVRGILGRNSLLTQPEVE